MKYVQDKEVEMEPLNSTGGGTHVKKSWMDMSSLTNLFVSNGHTGELSKPRKVSLPYHHYFGWSVSHLFPIFISVASENRT